MRVMAVAWSAMNTDVGVEDTAKRVATVTNVTEGVDSKVGVAGTVNAAPDLGLVGLGGLGEVEETLDVVLLVGVIDDALGVGVLVGALVGVSALLQLVAVVGAERLAAGLKVVDAIALTLDMTVSSLATMATIATVVVVTVASMVLETVVVEATEAATMGAIIAVLGGDGSNEGSASSSEFHFYFVIRLFILFRSSRKSFV